MAKVCPRCGGTEVNCPVCGYPPKRKLPQDKSVYKSLYRLLFGAKVWEVQGIDISKWNGQMNFAITKTKCQYGFIRLGYGTQWKDSACDTFYRDAVANDFPVGVYWYLNIGQDAQLTAQSFAEEIRTHSPQLDIVLDAETTTLNPEDTLNWLKEVWTKVNNLTGKRPIIYTSAGFWERVARSTFWSGKELWVANWTIRDYPTMPMDWYAWVHWQWSADGNLKAAEYGSTGGDPDMDLDRYNGTVVQFNAKYGTHIKPIGEVIPPPPTPEPPPGNLPEFIYPTTNLAIHSEPSPMLNNIIGQANVNTKWYPYAVVTANGRTWYQIGKHAYIDKYYTRL